MATAPNPDTHTPLEFQTDAGASRSVWIAGGLVTAIIVWFASGFFMPGAQDDTPAERTTVPPVSVAVTPSEARAVTQFFRAEGQAQPDRNTALRAETSGDVAQVLVAKGQDVTAGQSIAMFKPDAVEADRARAVEALSRAQREFDNAAELLDRGVATADRLAAARADLAAATSQVAAATRAADALTITAPFSGRVERLDLDAGEYIAAGTEVGRLVDITPLTVAIQVPQQALTDIKVGQAASVRFITGEEREGTVTFVGSSAASETRTFLAEIEIANADGAIPAGLSAEVRIPTAEVVAHFVSPSTVSLDTTGTLGIKTVDADNIVVFNPIEIVRAQIDGIWVTGLPDTADVITVGQGFVSAGEIVQAGTAPLAIPKAAADANPAPATVAIPDTTPEAGQ